MEAFIWNRLTFPFPCSPYRRSINGLDHGVGHFRLLRVCPTFYTSGNSASCGPFSRKSATSRRGT